MTSSPADNSTIHCDCLVEAFEIKLATTNAGDVYYSLPDYSRSVIFWNQQLGKWDLYLKH